MKLLQLVGWVSTINLSTAQLCPPEQIPTRGTCWTVSPSDMCSSWQPNRFSLHLLFSSSNVKFQTDSILRSWPYPSLQLLILRDSNLSNPAFVAYTVLWRIKSCEWYPVSLHSTQFCLLSGFTPICDERGILLSNQGLHVRWLWWWISIYSIYSNYIHPL